MTDINPEKYHRPVLLAEVLASAGAARRVVDGTLGGGGHAEALLAGGGELLGIDRDPEALAAAEARLGTARVRYLLGAYADAEPLRAIREFRPDFVLLDLGVSSRQLDAEARGFTFRPGAPLDMRMGTRGATAADLLNTADEAELRRIFSEYGDEPKAGRLARMALT